MNLYQPWHKSFKLLFAVNDLNLPFATLSPSLGASFPCSPGALEWAQAEAFFSCRYFQRCLDTLQTYLFFSISKLVQSLILIVFGNWNAAEKHIPCPAQLLHGSSPSEKHRIQMSLTLHSTHDASQKSTLNSLFFERFFSQLTFHILVLAQV